MNAEKIDSEMKRKGAALTVARMALPQAYALTTLLTSAQSMDILLPADEAKALEAALREYIQAETP